MRSAERGRGKDMSKESGLIYVPILHTRRETAGIARSLGDSANTSSTATQAPDDDDRSTGDDRSIQEMWDGIAAKLNDAHLPYERVRIFQEAMPVCGMEKEIAESLAAQGSRNHQLVLDLVGRGARLEGTENPDLLMQEHEYLTALIAAGAVPTLREVGTERSAFEGYQAKSKALMEKRDTFIAARIRSTIREGELPLVFMGVRHQLDKQLDGDFMITYLIYRLPFRKIGDIYIV